ncbi:hypothetical protein FN846DRAFT_998003 [Sphaerosporella brunnea]|uniref:Uncharacterized protein n=1 Tax=Sphaerosporella brunnea TaxID=1250544 RepID=A0A5J5F6H6_9PEZI|nr:hypothetical protein FN846DRAFT_998003 [Sphaerosporella brunnea]
MDKGRLSLAIPAPHQGPSGFPKDRNTARALETPAHLSSQQPLPRGAQGGKLDECPEEEDWVRPPSPMGSGAPSPALPRGAQGDKLDECPEEEDWVCPPSPMGSGAPSPALRGNRVPREETIQETVDSREVVLHTRRGRNTLGAGGVASHLEVHVAEGAGVDVTAAKYSLPPGHAPPYVRQEPITSADLRAPPPAFHVRRRVPISYKDSALNQKERADKFQERLSSLEKQVGYSGQYNAGPYIGGNRGSGLLRPTAHRGQENRRGRGSRRPLMIADRPYRETTPRYHGAGQPRPGLDTAALGTEEPLPIVSDEGPQVTSGEARVTASAPVADVITPTDHIDPGATDESEIIEEPEMVEERRIIYIVGLDEGVTLGHVLRSLGNTGRIEEIYQGAYEGEKFILIKFANQGTAAQFAEREYLPVFMSDGRTVRLGVVYPPPMMVAVKDVYHFEDTDSRVVTIGPCHCDFFVPAYVEQSGDGANLRSALLDYICATVHGAIGPDVQSKFLDISVETRGKMLKAVLGYSTIKAGIASLKAIKNLDAFRDTKVEFAQDPCQGDEECTRLGLVNRHLIPDLDMEQAEIDEQKKRIERARLVFQGGLAQQQIANMDNKDMERSMHAIELPKHQAAAQFLHSELNRVPAIYHPSR